MDDGQGHVIVQIKSSMGDLGYLCQNQLRRPKFLAFSFQSLSSEMELGMRLNLSYYSVTTVRVRHQLLIRGTCTVVGPITYTLNLIHKMEYKRVEQNLIKVELT